MADIIIIIWVITQKGGSREKGNSNTGFVTDICFVEFTVANVIPILGDTSVEPEWFIDSSILTKAYKTKREKSKCKKEDEKKSRGSLRLPPGFPIETRSGPILALYKTRVEETSGRYEPKARAYLKQKMMRIVRMEGSLWMH